MKTRSGKITTERVDDNKPNKEKEKFEEYLNFYENVLLKVSMSIKTLEELTKTTKAVKIFQRKSPAFFECVIDNFWAQSVIGLDECFHGEHYPIGKFLNYVESNWNKIFTGQWIETVNWDDGTVDTKRIQYKRTEIFQRIQEARNILVEKESVVSRIKAFRDKVFAHIDKHFPEEDLELIELREIFDVVEKTVNYIGTMYDYVYKSFEPVNSNDVRNLINIIEIYYNNRAEINKLRWGK